MWEEISHQLHHEDIINYEDAICPDKERFCAILQAAQVTIHNKCHLFIF